MKTLSKIILLFVLLANLNVSHAQTMAEEFVLDHNNERALHGVQPLSWSNTIATFAQNYANVRNMIECESNNLFRVAYMLITQIIQTMERTFMLLQEIL
jgi:hypothetical protein